MFHDFGQDQASKKGEGKK